MGILDQIVQFIEMNRSWLIYAPTIGFVAILLLWAFVGFVRGSRRSSYAFLLMLISVAVCASGFMYLYQDGGKNLYNHLTSFGIDFQNLLGKPVEGNSILEILQSYVFLYLGEKSQGVENIAIEMYPYIDVLAQALFKFVLFIVCLVAYFVILFVLNIFYFLFFSNRRYKKRLRKKDIKFRKRRIFGSLIGLTRGAIVGVITFSFIGSLLFAVTGDKKPTEDVKFTDDRIANIYDINNFVKELGSNGIFKILNGVKNEENTPYYLLITNMILSGNVGEQNHALTDQFASFTGLANDMLDLVGKHAGDEITVEILTGKDQARAQELLLKLFDDDKFNQELIEIIDKYQGTEYIKNLLKASTGSIIKNFGILMADMNPNMPEDVKQDYLGFYDTVFVNSQTSLKPSDLVTFDDVKLVFKAVVSSATEIIKFTEYSKNPNKLPNQNITLANKALNVYEKMFVYLEQLSIYRNDPVEYNKLIDNSVKFSFSILRNKDGNKYNNPFEGQNINWVHDSKGLFKSMNNIAAISDELADYQIKNNCDDLKTISKVFNNDYQNKAVIDLNYNQLVDSASNFTAVNCLLSSDLFYDKYEGLLAKTLNAPEVKLPRNISWGDKGNTEGELRKIFNILRNGLGSGSFDTILNDPKLTDLNNIKVIISDLTKPYNNTTLLDYLTESDFIYYTLSTILTNFKSSAIAISVPSSSLDVIENVDVVKKSEIKNLFNTLPVVLNEIPDLNVMKTDPLVFVDALKKDNVRETVIKSNILSSTASCTIYNLYNTNPSLSDYLYIPNKLAFNDTNNKDAVLEQWIGQTGELNSLLQSLKYVDVRKVMNNDMTAVYDITKLSRTDFDSLISSTILKASFPKLLTKFNNAQFEIKVPGDVTTKVEEYDVISNDELYSMLVAANKILSINPTTNQLDYNLDNILVHRTDVLSSQIISASVVNVLLSNPSASKFLNVPAEFKTVDYNNFKSSAWMVGYETDNNEINKIFNTFEILELKLSELAGGNINQNAIMNKVLTLDEQYQGKTKIEAICESKVLHLTLSNNLTTNPSVSSNVVVPEIAFVDPTSTDKYIKSSELLTLIKGLKGAFDLTSQSDLVTELNNVNALVAKLFNNFTVKKDQLLDSFILEETIINKLVEYLNSTPSDMLVIPEFLSLDNNKAWHQTRDVNGKVTASGELDHLLTILDVSGVGKLYGSPTFMEELNNVLCAESIIYTNNDSKQANALDILHQKENLQATLLNSYVVSASVINMINNQASTTKNIFVPEAYKYTNVKTEFNLNSTWLIDGELLKMFTSLNELKLPIVKNSFNIVITDFLSNKYDNNRLLESNVVWYTLSSHILQNDSLYKDSRSLEVKGTENYVAKPELFALLDAFNILKPETGSLDLNNIKISNIFKNYEANVNTLLKSSTLKLNITKAILDAFNSMNSINIPIELRFDFNTLTDKLVNVSNHTNLARFVEESVEPGHYEIKRLFDAINALNLGEAIDNKQPINLNVNDFIESNSNTQLENDKVVERQNALLSSLILNCTLANKIATIGVDIPNILRTQLNDDKGTYSSTNWYTNNEIRRLLGSLKVLDVKAGIDGNIAINPDSIMNVLTKENIALLHESSIVYLTLSNKLIDSLRASNLFLNKNSVLEVYPVYGEKVISQTELFNLTNGAKLLFNGKFSGTLSLPKESDISTILNSEILADSISEKVISEALRNGPITFEDTTCLSVQFNELKPIINDKGTLLLNKVELEKFIRILVRTQSSNNGFGINFTSPQELIAFLEKLSPEDINSKLLVSILNQIILNNNLIKNGFKYAYMQKVPTFNYKTVNVYEFKNNELSSLELQFVPSVNKEYVTAQEFVTFITTPSNPSPQIPNIPQI